MSNSQKILFASLGLLSVMMIAAFQIQQENLAQIPSPSSVETSLPPVTAPLPEDDEVTEEVDAPQTLMLNYLEEQSVFDLPLQGASAYGSIPLNLRDQPNGNFLELLPHGVPFTIVEEQGEWWLIDYEGRQGYVFANYCMINLPDVLPSAVYDNLNSYSAAYRSSFVDIPNVTGQQLYNSYHYNQRLGREEYTMPVLYQTAIKIAKTQRDALANNETLIICELYRPAEVQALVVKELTALSNKNPTVKEGISTPPWSTTWFISTGVSNHQRGYAIDCSLGKVLAQEEQVSGDYVYTVVSQYEALAMPTPLHELSLHSASMTRELSYVEVAVTPVPEETPEEETSVDDTTEEHEDNALPEPTPPTEAEPTPPTEAEPTPPTEAEPTPPTEAEPTPPTEAEPTPPTEAEPTPPTEAEPTPPTEAEPTPPTEAVPEQLLSVRPLTTSPYTATLSEAFPPTTVETVTQAVMGPWKPAETMTPAADRMEAYFLAHGMTSIYSEWWHFEDLDSNGGTKDNLGKYYVLEQCSLPPYQDTPLPEDT